jgi:hypothetical protein
VNRLGGAVDLAGTRINGTDDSFSAVANCSTTAAMSFPFALLDDKIT